MPGILARRPGRTLGGMAFDPRLGERFMFGEADLVANRDGRVSDGQARLIRRRESLEEVLGLDEL